MRYLFVLTAFLILWGPSYGVAKEIALSFDDAPRRLTGYFTAMERAKELVKAMKSVEVAEAAFFCNSSSIKEENKEVLKYYNDQGYIIANHTHSHLSMNTNDFNTYKEDFLRADKKLSKYSHFSRYFRFPYLREGNDISERNKMRELLKKRGYINAYITVDFSDWHLEDLFRKELAKKREVDLDKLKSLYISLAKESLAHYDSMAIKYLDRSPKHVLLLHETDIAALFIDDLVKALRSWGWKIISLKEAYSDELSQFKIKRPLKNNPGRVGELAIEHGHPLKDVWAQSTSPRYITERFNKEVRGR